VTWRQFFHTIEVAQRRARREAVYRQRVYLRQAAHNARDAARHAKQFEKEQKWLRDSGEAEQFEQYMEALVALHSESGDTWDWRIVAQSAPPPEPRPDSSAQEVAQAQIAAYQPGLLDRMTGAAKAHRTQLELALANAVATETARFGAAHAQYAQDRQAWEINTRLAPGVLRLEYSACAEALRRAFSFEDIECFGTKVRLVSVESDVAMITAVIGNDELVPREEVRLTTSGKLSHKAISDSKYWGTYQEHVCSCALRLALEVFAVLPVRRTIVNVARSMLDTSTGHMVTPTILALHVAREDLAKLNLDAIDPVASMKNFPHRMTFKKTSGFSAVEPMTADEQWASS
jgi:hypothetical protein